MLVDYERATGGTVARLVDVLAVDGGWLGVHGNAEARTRGARVALRLAHCSCGSRLQHPGSSFCGPVRPPLTARSPTTFLTSAVHEEPSRPKSLGMSLRRPEILELGVPHLT